MPLPGRRRYFCLRFLKQEPNPRSALVLINTLSARVHTPIFSIGSERTSSCLKAVLRALQLTEIVQYLSFAFFVLTPVEVYLNSPKTSTQPSPLLPISPSNTETFANRGSAKTGPVGWASQVCFRLQLTCRAFGAIRGAVAEVI